MEEKIVEITEELDKIIELRTENVNTINYVVQLMNRITKPIKFPDIGIEYWVVSQGLIVHEWSPGVGDDILYFVPTKHIDIFQKYLNAKTEYLQHFSK